MAGENRIGVIDPHCDLYTMWRFLNTHPLHVMLVARTAAAVVAIIDFYYTANKTIWFVYALDGIVETLFVII